MKRLLVPLALLSLAAAAAVAGAAYTSVAYVPTFDFDGNLLFTDATVKLEHFEGGAWVARNVTVAEWVVFQHDPTYRPSTTMDLYWDFMDEAGDGAFSAQVERSFKRQGPAFPLWREHFVRGVPFNVLTARGHDPANVKAGFERLVQLALSDADRAANAKSFLAWTTGFFAFPDRPGWWAEAFATQAAVTEQYMRGCSFVALSNPWQERRLACNGTAPCKAYAVSRFVEQALAYAGDPSRLVVVSFADDEVANIQAVRAEMENFLVPAHPELCFRVYDTSNASAPAVQIDLSSVCAFAPPGADWQSAAFLRSTNGVRVAAYN